MRTLELRQRPSAVSGGAASVDQPDPRVWTAAVQSLVPNLPQKPPNWRRKTKRPEPYA
jgi:hypothetical protein